MANDKSIYQICPNCKGKGIVVSSVDHGGDPPIFGPELEETACPNCKKTGYVEWGYLEG